MASKKKIYTVRACRWGDRETHSYLIGVFDKKHAAKQAANVEEEWRGGKYKCEILEWDMNKSSAGNHQYNPKEIVVPW